MSRDPGVVIVGGGLAGMAVAYTLVQSGFKDITIVERGTALGGLAGSFERDGRFYPLGYHHILHRDRTLHFFLNLIGSLHRVRWRRIRMLFELADGTYDLSSLAGFARFPMSVADKARFIGLMLRAFTKPSWHEWENRSACELIDRWAGAGVRRAVFEPLCQLKFQLPCEEVDAAWLGTRLTFREGSAPLGYIPNANWTNVLCAGFTQVLEEHGVRIRLNAAVARLNGDDGALNEVVLANDEHIAGEVFVSAVPTEVYTSLEPRDNTPHLRSIRYTSLVSAVCATRQVLPRSFYWMNLASLSHAACGLFNLSGLNPTIGGPGDTCLNFVTHLRDRSDPLFSLPPQDVFERYRSDFRDLFGFELEPDWTHVTRVPLYSPVFSRAYSNPPIRSTCWKNLYFAGNYRTFPSVASTGTALGSGLETGQALLSDRGMASSLPAAVEAFRVKRMPRG